MTAGMNVLCVDDDPDVLELTALALERASDTIDVTTAESGRDGLERVVGGDVDCVVSDYDMPAMDGLEFLEAVRARDPDVPFILFTGKGSEEIAIEAISAGVTDYLQKGSGTDQYDVLANRIENAVEKRRVDRERRRSERELERYRTLVETAVDPMFVLDESGYCTVANEAFADFLGVDRERLVGARLESVVDETVYERSVEMLLEMAETETREGRFEFTVDRPDGRERIGEVHLAALIEDDEYAGSVGVVRDVSARKRRERELAEYERIVELAPIALFILDDEGTITWFNDEFVDAYAESADQLDGLQFTDLIDRGYYDERVIGKYTEEIRRLLSSSDAERAKYDVEFRSADGDTMIHDVHTKLLPPEDGEFAGTIHAIRDITTRRRYQRELERQNDRLEEFASLVSHDLRNPLNVAQGNLEVHAERCDGDEESLKTVRWSLDRMAELIEDLLSLARNGRTIGDRDTVALSRLVRDAWDAVETDRATLSIEDEQPIVADEARVRELFENLFRNAVEHGSTSPDSHTRQDDAGREPSGEPSVADAPEDAVEPEPDGAAVTVTVGLLERDGRGSGWYVEDDGPGLPEGIETDRFFESGYTTSETGTGLGLAIVREIVDAHGWTVVVGESEAGGARFEIRGVTARDDGASTSDGEREHHP